MPYLVSLLEFPKTLSEVSVTMFNPQACQSLLAAHESKERLEVIPLVARDLLGEGLLGGLC